MTPEPFFFPTCTLFDVGLHSTSSAAGTTLTQCLANVCCIGPALSECWTSISCRVVTQQTQNMCITLQWRSNIVQMLYKCVVFTAMSVFRDIRWASWEGAILPFILCLRLWMKSGGAASAFSCFNHPAANVLPFNYLWIGFFVGFELSLVCVSVSVRNTFVKFYWT